MTQVAVIMAGGYGERFWPMSRLSRPKQFLKIFSDHSMVRETFLRLLSILPAEQIFVVTGGEFKDRILGELPEMDENNIIIEPCRRDTAAAIALSAIHIEKQYPAAVMLIVASDHIIPDLVQFKSVIDSGFKIAKDTSCLLTIGIQPARPETAYGYIEIGDTISHIDGVDAYEVKQFVEKPDYNRSVQYIEAGNFLWNSGMFIWETQTFLDELSIHLPELYSGILEIGECLGKKDEGKVILKVFEGLSRISIDYGLMEKCKNILCITGTFSWDDVGSWSSLYRCLNKDDDNNIRSGQVLSIDTKDSIILGDQSTLIGVVGVKDLIIVKTRDAILICHKNDEQKVKDLVMKIQNDDSLHNFL